MSVESSASSPGLRDAPMTRSQKCILGVLVAVNAVDGFDVLSISFASPGIVREWGINTATLGLVLSMELIGTAFGAIILGRLSDRIGRKLAMLINMLLISFAMFGCSTAASLSSLMVWRLLTGLGIGGLVPALTALVSETANDRSRHAMVSLLGVGYTLGAIIGGSIVVFLLQTFGWRSIFFLGGGATLAMTVVVFVVVPESVSFLLATRKANFLARVNTSLRKLGHVALGPVPPLAAGAGPVPYRALFAPGQRATTIGLAIANCCHLITFYFALKWVPKIVSDMGYNASTAAGVLVWVNVGGLIGSLTFIAAIRKFELRHVSMAVLTVSSVVVAFFGVSGASGDRLTLFIIAATLVGVVTNAGVVGLFALMASAFPRSVRGGGVGFAHSSGRAGAMLGPIVAGYLFQMGFSLPIVAASIALGSLIAVAALRQVRLVNE